MSQTESRAIIDEGVATFSSDSKLLAEIGERLIASPEVALTELIKNAYDADATKCNIWLDEKESNAELIVKDDGHGMTEQEFLDYWMTIATTSRLDQETSRRYNRDLTGAKGVGRFAVRNLGLRLELITVAYYEQHDEHRRLRASFEWADFESGQTIQQEDITYQIESASPEEEGTELRISQLQRDWSQKELKEVSGDVLDIISAPYETNRKETGMTGDEGDPGFSVYFSEPGNESPEKSAAQEIYERYAAKVNIQVDENRLLYECEYAYDYDEGDETIRQYEIELENNYVGDLSGEIRYHPQNYSGLFRNMETIDGRSVSRWLREHGGIRVIDRGFRVPPYGDLENDWLNISDSQARRERKWRSPFTTQIESMSTLAGSNVKERQLNLPAKQQILGHLNIASFRPEDEDRQIEKLVPAMDRQGFVENKGMEQLKDIARGAVELIAIIDKEEEIKQARRDYEESKGDLQQAIEESKKEINETVERVVDEKSKSQDSSLDEFTTDQKGESTGTEQSDTSLGNEKNEEMVTEVKTVAEEAHNKIEEKANKLEKKQEELHTSLESMYLMSTVSAFMTHETSELLKHAKKMIAQWESVPEEERSEEFNTRLEETRTAKEKFEKQLGYARRFMSGLDQGKKGSVNAYGKVLEVVEQFNHYTKQKDITVRNRVDDDIWTPELNPSVYSGVIMNLFTNAIKATLEVPSAENGRIIRFDAEENDDWHIIRVSDTGSGIPEELEDRIFDPLFSTTGELDEDPLGGGTGLGLYVVEKIVEQSDGEISIVEPPENFETCFEVRFKYD